MRLVLGVVLFLAGPGSREPEALRVVGVAFGLFLVYAVGPFPAGAV